MNISLIVGGGVSGIKFKDVGCNGTGLNHSFVINVGQFYALYDIKRPEIPPRHIKVVSIDYQSIYYKEVNDHTDGGEFTKSVLKKNEDQGLEPPVSITKINLGTAVKFIPVTNFSGTEKSKPVYVVSELHPTQDFVREGGRNKRGKKSKKYSKTKSKSITRRGGRRSRRVRRIKRKSRR